MPKKRRLSRQIIALIVVGVLALAAVTGWIISVVGKSGGNPFSATEPYVYPDSEASKALATATADQVGAFTRLAETPTAIWVLPEAHATADVGNFVATVAGNAEAADRVAVFVVYGIPNRDCANESAGGLSAEEYPAWVSSIAAGLEGHKSVVILEPDALALSTSCESGDDRAAQINDAIDRLVPSGATIYLDGGHSTWLPAAQQADLLTAAGIAKVRGFASNVSNYNATDSEKAYGAEVSELTGGSHYVIDTGRNGNGSNGEWCNPSGRALGEAPTVVDDGSALDALLWIKNPGESDGSCNGGPAAGEWWPQGAVDLAK